jgi:anaerobic dimethyl sulfoxide reductase subunit A
MVPGEYGFHGNLEAELWHHAVLERERYEKGEISLEEYKAEIGCPGDAEAPNIQMIFYHLNPRNFVLNYYDSNARIEAIKKVEFVVYSSYSWVNTTTWYADLVLPLAHQFFEGGGGGGLSMENYIFHSHYSGNAGNYFIGGGKNIEPPGECRTKLWIMKEVANRLGIGDRFAPRIKDVPWEDFDATMRTIAGEQFNQWREWPEIKRLNPPTWEEFQKLPLFIRPIEGDYGVWMRDNIENNEPLETPSGKIEFYSEFLANKDYRHLPHNTKVFGKGVITPMGKYKDPPYSLLQPVVKKHPLYLITPHAFYRQHFCQDENPWFRDEYRSSVWISAADARARDIKDDDLVLVHNDVGQVVLPAYVTSRLLPGVTCMIFGRQYEPSGVKTDLMPDGIDRAGSSNFLVPDEHFDARRGILLCNSMVQIDKFDRSLPF